ncbi:hypothetical protein CHI12_16635 [Terribacillus saccharophilus]|uniref:Uncharacterized protein n=1 Tax=Terribacillus saccharophilus TaxID=361277 RepID=A0A268H958_9BACI|nr:hypothetical protein [Terribacillus saccharophilus]PAE06401.1 hypothetical protein CHI12_16635 [Terribacillus saccharophilus]
MNKDLRPNEAETLFLNLAYNGFYDIFEEVFNDTFWENDSYYRFAKVNNAFSIYAELLNYEPIKWVLEAIKLNRPPMEAELGKDLFKFIRNVFSHFPYFTSWDVVWVNKSVVNWNKKGQSIDRFLTRYSGKEDVKYRFWEEEKRKMTYLSINFPTEYNNDKIFLKDILSEKEGVKFSMILMKQIMDSQIVSTDDDK